MIEFNPDLLIMLLGMTCTLAGGSRLRPENLFLIVCLDASPLEQCDNNGSTMDNL